MRLLLALFSLIATVGCTTSSALDKVYYQATARTSGTVEAVPQPISVLFELHIADWDVQMFANSVEEPPNLAVAERMEAIITGCESAGLNVIKSRTGLEPRYIVVVVANHTPFNYSYGLPVPTYSSVSAYNWSTGELATGFGTSTTYIPASTELMRGVLYVVAYDAYDLIERGRQIELWTGTASFVGVYDAITLREDVSKLLSYWGQTIEQQTLIRHWPQ